MRYLSALYLFLFIFSSCGSTSEMSDHEVANISPNSNTISYLALGDSYTIGESVAESERWPVQLADKFRNDGFSIENPKIIARTGWRTDELLEAMNEELGTKKYDLVSVLIGVNNQYQNRDIEQFQQEFKVILQKAIAQCKTGKKGVFVVSIPDYGVTPFAQHSNTKEISNEIAIYNEVCKNISANVGVKYVYITDISKEAEFNSGLIAGDGLHPSGEMYRRWVEKIYSEVRELLNK
ncbi:MULTISPECIES: SGNH/GDSL hydrolase family protein [Mesonia]|uniref:Uncharacterized protein n=1 Tax=Mesonia oceanica TaxID=2687242 RepID=A0AC61Y9Q4_9FLAO|nr:MULTISPECIES: SGNH/GDSL hydrolase family protein [Mesonia]MAN27966.1 lysophospholipase [Mesonia sp.]MAQ41146.1 lysophospholipase [Mesonia sp.]VVV01244.1 hypothetical protein FVB9532_02529 [Mesonia oceanica]|tara:strand:- start:8669 stop:9379 length:711 start_codon:yes stop_codon:yes gene_type:complete